MFNNKGLAFAATMGLILLLAIASCVFLISSYNSVNVNEALARRARAITLAESGINYALWKIRVNQDSSNPPNPMSDYFPGSCFLYPPISIPTGWTIEVEVVDSGTGRKTIKSKVTYPKSTIFQET